VRALGLLSVSLVTACVQQPANTVPPSLSQKWMIGVERMQGDPLPQLPFTNRFIAGLAAMPNTQLVYLGSPENAGLFASWSGNRLDVAPMLRAERSCMTLTYTIFQSGQQQSVYGLMIPVPQAGSEPDSACVDRAAGAFYQALAVQGL
jgi:hypothetical protein